MFSWEHFHYRIEGRLTWRRTSEWSKNQREGLHNEFLWLQWWNADDVDDGVLSCRSDCRITCMTRPSIPPFYGWGATRREMQSKQLLLMQLRNAVLWSSMCDGFYSHSFVLHYAQGHSIELEWKDKKIIFRSNLDRAALLNQFSKQCCLKMERELSEIVVDVTAGSFSVKYF